MKIITVAKILVLAVLFASPCTLQAATIIGNLAGLQNPTGAATNGNLDRQYAWTILGSGAAAGAQVTVTYTLSTSAGNLSEAFNFNGIFRYPGGLNPDPNLPIGESLTITIDNIEINSGWTLNSVSMTDTVQIRIEGGTTARFSVNGLTPFDYLGTGTGVNTEGFTNSQFQDFNSVGDSISFLNVDQTTNGGMNLRDLQMTFDVVPEPSAALLSGLGFLLLLLRRHHGREN